MFLSLSLTALLAFLAYVYVRNHWEEFSFLWSRPIGYRLWLTVGAAYTLTLVFNSEILRLGIVVQGTDIKFLEGLALNMSTMAANYFIPLKGGAGLRAIYFLSRYRMPLTNFISQLLAISVHTLAVGSFLALISLLVMAPERFQGPLVGYFAVTFGLGLGSLLYLGRINLTRFPKLNNLAKGWDLFRADKKALFKLTVFQLAYYFSLALVNHLCFKAFHISLSLPQALFYSAGQIHSTIINLTPAGLGIVETFGILAGQILGFSPAHALMAQGLNRLTQLSVMVLISLWGWPYLNRLKSVNPPLVKGSASDCHN
ncbi:MAG: flippase-like domain-containing protein [Deltaproteobacteria bacterium]|nr:flippase-like domain-containing protein [Deltaproteobacteria bacterium]